MNGYNPQIMNFDKQILEERNKIAELERQKMQALYTPPTILNQTIQAGPQSNGIKYAESIDEVNREMVFTDTLFINKGFTNLWFKNPRGEVKTYLLEEFIPKDEKDIKIENLEKQLNDLKKEITNNASKYSSFNQSNNSTVESTISPELSTTTANETNS